ncbi:glycosyltransferase family 4 protein [Candidatus Poribacteria bacterium]|nr:glycosyltransferase family 4 protein [Candidatus Poribacteria bacterium]
MAPFTIGYDASSTLAPRTGIGRAALELLRAMAAADEPEFLFRVFVNSMLRRMGGEHGFLKSPRISVRRTRRPGPWLVGRWRAGKGPGPEELLGAGLSLFHASASYMPPGRRSARVITVNDLAFLEQPAHERAPLGGAWFHEVFPRVLPECALIHTPTEFVRRQVIEHYRVPDYRVVAIPWGVDSEVFHPETERHVMIARQYLGLPSDPYLLAVSDHDPRKDAGLLLDTYGLLRAAEPATPPLAVLGWGGKPHEELRRRPRLYRHVLLLGRAEDKHLAGLYSGAVATILTSRHEGFGFPLLEAQACGSPVVCGDHTGLAEIGGGAFAPVRGRDPAEWAEAMRGVVFGQSTRDRLRRAGLENAVRYTWADCARRMLEQYRAVAVGSPN